MLPPSIWKVSFQSPIHMLKGDSQVSVQPQVSIFDNLSMLLSNVKFLVMDCFYSNSNFRELNFSKSQNPKQEQKLIGSQTSKASISMDNEQLSELETVKLHFRVRIRVGTLLLMSSVPLSRPGSEQGELTGQTNSWGGAVRPQHGAMWLSQDSTVLYMFWTYRCLWLRVPQ